MDMAVVNGNALVQSSICGDRCSGLLRRSTRKLFVNLSILYLFDSLRLSAGVFAGHVFDDHRRLENCLWKFSASVPSSRSRFVHRLFDHLVSLVHSFLDSPRLHWKKHRYLHAEVFVPMGNLTDFFSLSA